MIAMKKKLKTHSFLNFPDLQSRVISLFYFWAKGLIFFKNLTSNFFLFFFPFLKLFTAINNTRYFLSRKLNIFNFFSFASFFNYFLLWWCSPARIWLKIFGVGYFFKLLAPQLLFLNVGYSHGFEVSVPLDLSLSLHGWKKKVLVLTGINWLKVFNAAFKIRALWIADAYRGKGIRFFRDKLVLKEGKKKFV